MRQVVLITGLMGSGKSTVAEIIASRGHEVIYMDAIAKSAIDNEFNEEFKKAFGTLSTATARKLYFKSEYKTFREQFESKLDAYLAKRIVHLLDYVDPDNKEPLFIEVPAMRYSRFKHFTHMFEQQIKNVILVTVNTAERCKRLIERRAMTYEQIIERSELQSEDIPVDKNLIITIENNGSLELLEKIIEQETDF